MMIPASPTAQEKVNFTFTMDRTTRDNYSRLCDALGLSMSSATYALVKQAVRDQKITLNARDENGFTSAESTELMRRFAGIRAGIFEEHSSL